MDPGSVSTTRLDSLSKRQWVILGCAWVVALSIFIGIGGAGPSTTFSRTIYSYGCPNGGAPAPCFGGVEMRNPNNTWNYGINELSRFSKFFGLFATPYNLKSEDAVSFDLTYSVSLYGFHDDGTSVQILKGDTDTHLVQCPMGAAQCSPPLALALIDFVTYGEYDFSVRFLNAQGEAWLGDVAFTFFGFEGNFSKWVLGWSLTFFVLTVIIGCAYFITLSRTGTRQIWAFEQWAAILLLIGCLGFNNIFYPLEFLSHSGFVAFMTVCSSSAWPATFYFVILCFYDRILKEGSVIDRKRFYVPKLVLVGVLVLFEVILGTMFSVAERRDPVNGVQNETGIRGLFIFILIWRWIIILYLFVLITRVVMELKHRVELRSRVLLVSVPALSIILGEIISRSVHGWRPSSMAYLVILWLVNSFTWMIVFAWSPGKAVFGEASRLTANGDDNNM